MRAVLLTGHGGLDKLKYVEDFPIPQPAVGEVLLKIAACGLNNTDINTRSGWYSSDVVIGTTAAGARDGFVEAAKEIAWGGALVDFPRIQGADVCATVVALGDGTPAELKGKRVLVDTWLRDWNAPADLSKCRYFGSECNGGYADYVTVSAKQVHPINSALSDAELATFATSYSTAENMLAKSMTGQGDTVLITGATGGVGSALIQLARRRGAIPIAIAAREKWKALQAALGDVLLLPRDSDDLAAEVKKISGKEEVDVVADVVGGDIWQQFISLLKRGGRYACSGAIAGPIVRFDLRDFYLNDITMSGATITPPGLFADLVGYIERGEIKPLLADTFPMRDIVSAQEMFIAKKHVGNIVITMEG